MNEEKKGASEATVAPAAPAPDKNKIQSVYPSVGEASRGRALPQTPSDEEKFAQASSALDEALTLICGVGSATGYLLILYFFESRRGTLVFCTVFATAAVFFAVRNYRRTKTMSPWSVIGLAAATISLMYVANYLVVLQVLRSATNGLY